MTRPFKRLFMDALIVEMFFPGGKCEMSLEELKSAANEIKCLRPVQEAVVNFLKLNTWEENLVLLYLLRSYNTSQ